MFNYTWVAGVRGVWIGIGIGMKVDVWIDVVCIAGGSASADERVLQRVEGPRSRYDETDDPLTSMITCRPSCIVVD